MIKQIARELQLLPHLLKGGHKPSEGEVEKFFANPEIVSMQTTCAKCELPIDLLRSEKNPENRYLSKVLLYVNVDADRFVLLKTTFRDGSSRNRTSKLRN